MCTWHKQFDFSILKSLILIGPDKILELTALPSIQFNNC